MDIIVVIALLSSLGLLVSKKIGSYRFPGTVLIITFGMLYIWNKCGVLTFYKSFSFIHVIYLVACLNCFNITAYIATKMAKRKRLTICRITRQNNYIENKVWLLNVIGIIGGLLLIFDMRGSISASGFVLDNLNDMRNVFTDRTTGIMGQVGSILFGTALPGLILGMRQWLRMDMHSARINSILLSGLIIVMFGVALLSGGRQAVLEIILTFIAVLLYGGIRSFNRKRIKTFILASLLISVLGSTYMVTVASQRAEFGMAGETFLLKLWDARYSDWYSPLAVELPPKLTLPLIAIHGYFPYNLTGLAVFLEVVDDHAWGGFQGVHLLRQLRKLGIEWPFEATIKAGYDVSNINWPTIFGAMILDFGVIGSIIAIFFLGWQVGTQFGRYFYFDMTSGYLFTALGFVFIFHSTMYSPFQEMLLLYGLIWSIILNVRSLFIKKPILLKLNDNEPTRL